MPKGERSEIVKVEIIAPERSPRPNSAEVLGRMVQVEVAKIMANRDDWLFQPFLQSKRISDEMRRMQNIPEQRKWAIYFKKWGCLICGRKASDHSGCGMCPDCRHRTHDRLSAIVKACKSRSQEVDFGIEDDVQIARRALGGNRKALPAKSVRQTRVR